MKTTYLFLAFCVISFGNINAQNIDIKKVLGIEGYVADEITHEPLSGSLIEMFSTDSILITSTKTKGVRGQKIARYRLYGERKKEYILKVSKEGYETDYITLDSDVLGKREQIYIVPTVYLKRIMEFELDEVAVTISTAATIKPINGAPKLGVPGDWTKDNQYEVTAADGTKKVWTIVVEPY